MADNLDLPATGAKVGTDEVSIGGVVQHVQRMKLVDGTDGGTEVIPGTAARGLSVDPRLSIVRLAQTPTISTTAYAAKDAVGALLTFAGAVRAAGGAATLTGCQIVDRAQQRAAMDLLLFDRSITAPTDNAAFDPTDAELAYCVGIVPIASGYFADLFDNAVADVPIHRDLVLNGTDLYGVLVSRTAPTYASTADLTVTLTLTRH